jgi:hypothetical protein
MVNGSLDDLAQRLSAYTLSRDVPSSAPVTPPTSQFYDPRSRASTLTESSPPLQALQKDHRVPQHYLTPPAEGLSSPASLAVSQSLPVSRRNSNTEAMRGSQDLSVIYENGPDKYHFFVGSINNSVIYPQDHRKSSGTWSTSSPEATFASSPHGYDEAIDQRNGSTSSKQVFGMLKTQDGAQFPYLAESVSPYFAVLNIDPVKPDTNATSTWREISTRFCSFLAVGPSYCNPQPCDPFFVSGSIGTSNVVFNRCWRVH